MATVIDQKSEELVELAERLGVQELYVFGSADREDFVPGTSDVDFLVRFKPCSLHQRRRRFFDLIYALEDLFGARADLFEIDAVKNPYLQREMEATRRLVYAA